jgi:3-hydroxyanthranilate 3,4-dioxygenase
MTQSQLFAPLNFRNWIEENRHLLRPPVGNRQIWENREFMVTVVGGPNCRADYHVNEGEEFFYQVEGDIVLKVLNEGKAHDIVIREGDVYLLPRKVPHSPQRPAGTIGLVLERKRLAHELDGFLWFCPNCNEQVHQEFFHLTDIVTQLPPVFDRFFSNPEQSTCKKCGARVEKN